MGFFKNIGKAIKKGVKQISLKNVVKVASSFDPTGIVGGIQQAHEIKKQERAEQDAARKEELAYQAQVLAEQAAQKVGTVTGTLAGQFGKTVLQETYNGLDKGFKAGAGVVAANVADEGIKAWFKKHWQKLAIGVGALVAVVLAWRYFRKPKRVVQRRY